MKTVEQLKEYQMDCVIKKNTIEEIVFELKRVNKEQADDELLNGLIERHQKILNSVNNSLSAEQKEYMINKHTKIIGFLKELLG